MKRFKHSLSNYRLTTGDMGKVIPVNCIEVLPGDTFQGNTSALIRVSPLQAPVMHPCQVRIHHWFVPNRILWDGWEDFITGGPDGTGTSESFPTVSVDGATGHAKLPDYLGVPVVDGLEINALPIRAYNKIWNEFYRDQDLAPEVDPDSVYVNRCAWEKDYFTSARPWAQKGPEISLPIGTSAPVLSTGASMTMSGNNFTNETLFTGTSTEAGDLIVNNQPQGATGIHWGDESGLMADLSQAETVDIREFRLAFALQRYQEARARYGSRYTEYLRYLGVRSSDARLQLPEYLGGGKQTISFSEVLRTGNSTGDTENPIGEMYGHGIAAVRSNRYRKFFEEHGFVLTLMSVRPKSIYVDGCHRKWLKRNKEEYFQKELEAIGQQSVWNSEVYADASANGFETFGYADRYREYREEPSGVSAEFRELLDYWHLGRKFETAPVLNNSFVSCNPTKRVFSEQTQHSLWCMVNNSVQARRMVNRSAVARII